jgi:hypothetical protein
MEKHPGRQAFLASVRHLAAAQYLDLVDLRGAYLNLDGGFDSTHNRQGSSPD